MNSGLRFDDIVAIEQQIQNGTFNADEYFQELAYNNAASAGDFKLDGAAGVGLGLIGFAFFGWMGAAGVFVLTLARIFQKTSHGAELTQSIEQGNIEAIASFLPPLERQEFMTMKARQAISASEGSQQPSSEQATYLQANTQLQAASQQPQLQAPVPRQPAQPPLGFPTSSTMHHTVELINPHSQFVPVATTTADSPALPVYEAATSDETDAPADATVTSNEFDTAQKIADMGVRSLLWIGGSGTAKSLTATTALKRLKAANPAIQVWCVSAKCDELESGYWTGFDRYSFYDFLTCDKESMIKAFSEWAGLIREFKASGGMGILLFDELSLIMSYAKKIRSVHATEFREEFEMFMLGMSSAGRSTGRAVWGISPNGALNALGGLTKAQLGAFICVFNAQLSNGTVGFNHGVWVDASNNGMAPPRIPSKAEEQTAIDAGCTLLTGMNGQWFPTMSYSVPPRDPGIIQKFTKGGHASPPQETAYPWANSSFPTPQVNPRSTVQKTAQPVTAASVGTADTDLRALVDRNQMLILTGILDGKSKNQLAQQLKLKPGGMLLTNVLAIPTRDTGLNTEVSAREELSNVVPSMDYPLLCFVGDRLCDW